MKLTLRLVDVRQLNARIERDWARWVENAPVAWKLDGFIVDHVPITVTSRFGQDQPICAIDSRDEEANNWYKERCYHKIRFVSVGLATHVRCVPITFPLVLLHSLYLCSAKQVDEWVALDEDHIQAEHDIIFDSWDIESRNVIEDLSEIPLYDDTGKEIRIYSSDGRKIARRGAHLAPDTKSCGVLVNLRTITSVFQPDDNNVDMEEETDEEMDMDEEDRPARATNRVSLSVYPQAFLRDYGHIQAKGPLQLMQPIIETINASFEDDRQDADISSDGPGLIHSTNTPVTGISTQMYNRMFHKAATQAGALDVQRGRLTGALSGGGATTTKGKKTAQLLRRYCNAKLPHARFADRVDITDCPSALRVESVYVVDMLQIPEHDRDGRTLYQKLICILVDAWSRTEVSDRLKSHLLVLTPEVCTHHIQFTSHADSLSS